MRHNRLAVALALIALVALPAAAQELTGTLKKIKDTGTITIGHRDSSIPFSYYDENQKPVGYAMDICYKIVDAVKQKLNMPNLKVALNPVTSATRIPLMANGTIDLECGSTTNNAERKQQVDFGMTYFVVKYRYVTKASSGMDKMADMKGKTMVSTAGTTDIKALNELNTAQNYGMNILSAKDHAEAFLMVETGRAAAFLMDDILLYGLVANSKNPKEFHISSESLGVEPYSLMLRKDDPQFKKVVDDTMTQLYKSGEIEKIYHKWFESPIPPKGINLNFPISDSLKKVFQNPTDNSDPKVYS
ncbi:MAG TPA: transporter substrate-binding domain-containing protein [Casimicrobiaceae bacterium]|jgi:glutamate/aspartate transport system substrate-binding protein|nr:transporter substrate-binding domain-containing protein [Casimicrobiaceae bacterium]